jgi:hypothetical protein
MLCYAREFVNDKRFMEGRDEVETTNVRDDLQHQKPKKMLRKSVKLLT